MNLTDPMFQNVDKAREHLEATRWPHGPICPHCGTVNEATKLEGRAHRAGVYQCNACREQFTVTVGTVFERSKVPLNKWLLASYLMAASKKGVSAHQLHRTLGVTYKTAWFMAHRLREAMRDDSGSPLGGDGKVVEADETFIGPADDVFVSGAGWQKKRGTKTKRKVMTLVERGGRARSFHVEQLDRETIRNVLFQNVDRASRLHTDEAQHYKAPGRDFAKHERVNHSKEEYARGDVTTNTVEGFFSIFKRGMTGIYQHCGEQHLHRYLAEYDFRYSFRIATGVTDTMRADELLRWTAGKRLTYRRVGEAAHA